MGVGGPSHAWWKWASWGVMGASPTCQHVLLTVQVRKGMGEALLPQASWGGPETAPPQPSQLALLCLTSSRPPGPHLCSLLVPSAHCTRGCSPVWLARHVTFGPPSLPPCDPHVASGEAETNPQISPLGTFQRQRHQRGQWLAGLRLRVLLLKGHATS